MPTLTVDAQRTYEGESRENSHEVIASDVIYKGAAVGDNANGYARPLQAGDPFYGFAIGKTNNLEGSAGDKRVHVYTKGRVHLDVAGVTSVGDVGEKVYAADDATFTKTATNNSLIGVIIRHLSGTACVVEFAAYGQVV
ncbi:MAG: cytoplasmic protein [Cyanobacteria bacterium P01_H01_bin.74]